jgi:hypothetical protein
MKVKEQKRHQRDWATLLQQFACSPNNLKTGNIKCMLTLCHPDVLTHNTLEYRTSEHKIKMATSDR